MITTTQMYWLTRLDELGSLGFIMTALGLIVTIITTAIYATSIDETTEPEKCVMRNILRVSIPTLAIGISISVFVPNTKDMAAILVVPRITNSESLSDIADGAKTLAVEWLEELRPGAQKAGGGTEK